MKRALSGIITLSTFIFVIAFFIATIIANRSAFAADVNVAYNKKDCTNLGTKWKKGRIEFGCSFWVTPMFISDDSVEVTEKYVGTGRDLVRTYDFYTTNKDGQAPTTCANGFKGGRKNGRPGCVREDNKANGFPSSKGELVDTEKKCKSLGGVFTSADSAFGCVFLNKEGETIGDGIVGGASINEPSGLPRSFSIAGKDKKCPSGYKSSNVYNASDIRTFCEIENNDNSSGQIDPDAPDAEEGGGDSDKSSCKIDGVGWIVCPGANFLSRAVMDSYKFIADNMLQVRSNELFTNSSQDKSSGKSLMEIWGNFRDIANILFVILFSIVIISQITSLGISNYGIKKMLPRLLIFAILINVSYYISVIAVDASNILGRSIYNTIIGSVEWSGAASSGVHSLGQVVAGGLALSTGAILFGETMLLALISAAIGMAVMIITLMIRQAAVIILVVLSPIAFASAILPNTEGIFNKWKSIFKSMLVIYPMASIVVSLSVLASNTLAATASGPFSFLIEGLYLTLPFVGMAGVVALIRGALAALDKLTNANITGKLSSLAGGANKFMGNTSVAKHAANWSRGNRGALTGRNKNPTTRTGRILSAIGGLGGKRGLGIAATAGYFRDSRLRADSNARVIEENQKWDDEDRSIAILEQKEANGIITDSERRSLNSLRAVKQKREDDQITAQARANAIKWKMAPVKDILDNSGNIITPSTETLAKTSLANAIASRDSDKIKMAVESAKMVYGQNKTNNMISNYIDNNGISQESAHALSNNFYKDFKDSSPSLSSTIEYAKSNSKGIETETVRVMDPATGKMIDKIQANQSQINKAVDGAFDNIKMAVVNNMDAEEVKKWNAALYKMPTPERKMHARMAREAERNGAGDVKQRTELSNLYRIHK